MAKREKKEIKCVAHYTEGCEKRLTEALVHIYYNRKMGISGPEVEKAKISSKDLTKKESVVGLSDGECRGGYRK